MTTTSISTPVPPADIGTRLVHLIAGIRNPNDLSAERIERLTGMPIRFDPDDENRYGFGAMLDDVWACNLATIPSRDGSPKRLVLTYDDISGHPTETVPASAPEFESFAHVLRDTGFAQSIISGPRGAIYGHRFVRDGVAVDVHTEREDAMAAEPRFRVSRVVIDATEAGHD